MSKLEDVLESLNGFGRYQKLLFLLVCLSGLLPPLASYMHSFIAASPKYSCSYEKDMVVDFVYNYTRFQKCIQMKYQDFGSISTSGISNRHVNISDINASSTISSSSSIKGLSIDSSSISSSSSIISSNGNSSANEMTTETTTKNASSSHPSMRCVFDKSSYKMTLTEEWNLVCDKALLRSNMQAIYFTGSLVGYLIQSVLSKRLGQKTTLIISLMFTLIGSVLLSFGPQRIFGNVISYILLSTGRFLIAIGAHGVSVNAYILAIETMARSKKQYFSLIFESFFSFGQLFLVLAAFFLRDWRHLTYIIFIPLLPFVAFICVTNESLQYLMVNKKYDEVRRVLENIAKFNKTRLDDTLWVAFLEKGRTEKKRSQSLKKQNVFFTLILVIDWIINGLVFHGLGLRSNDLGANPYLTFAMSAVFEFIASLFTFKLLQYNSRRKPYLVLITIASICCLTIYFSGNLILIVMCALLAKFSISSSYAVIRVYSSEFFIQYERKNDMNKCSTMAKIGSIIAPYIIGLGDYHFKKLPFLIFGIACILSALLSLALPRTNLEQMQNETKVEISQQIIQNNWLDGEDLYMDKESIEPPSQAGDKIELK